jgi:hypothetical protein
MSMMPQPSRDPEYVRRHSAPWLGLIALVTMVIYARSCGAPFQFDDHVVVAAHEEGHLSTPWQVLSFARTRLVPFATFALNYVVGGARPAGFHAVNVAIHTVTAALVYWLALALCATPRLRATWLADMRAPFAVMAALLFASHPIQVQAVAYVIQRISALAALWYVASVLLYVRARNAEEGTEGGRPAVLFLGSALCGLAAFLSKENTVSLPIAVLLTEWTFFGGAGLGRRLMRLMPYALLALAVPVLWKLLTLGRGGVPVGDAPFDQLAGVVRLLMFRANPSGDLTPLDYLLTQCVVIPRYLRLVLVPIGQNVDHDVPVERGLGAEVAGGLVFLVALLGFGLYALRRWPVLGFGIVWIFVALSVESSVLPIRDVMVEHRMYLAMPGLALAAGSLFAWGFTRQRVVAVAVGGGVIAVLAALTVLRNEVWRTPLSLWQDALAKSPGKARVHTNVGMAWQTNGDYRKAIEHYCRALELDARNQRARANLDIAVEQDAEARLEAGEDVALDGVTLGGSGPVIELKAADPCRDR